ncbi:MAG: choline-sulfatase [Pirellula sp.]|nr:choline-sulfatase [Pirellula sp.]
MPSLLARVCRTLLLLSALLLLAPCQTGIAGEPPRPNILLVVADDMRPDAVSALGNPAIRTPALDALVRRGTSFVNATCAYPICVVSRAELLTGCTAFRALKPYPSGKLNDQLTPLPKVLQAGGYRTAYVGKWHTTGTPHTCGYEQTRGWYGAGAGKLPLTNPTDHRGHPVTGYNGWVFKDDAGKPRPELGVGLTPNISEQFADAAIELMERPADSHPFFIHVNFTAPHDPRLLPRGYKASYDAAKLPLPKNFVPDHPFEHGNLHGRDEVLLPRPLTPELIRNELAVYYALIEHLDAQIGRITAALEKSGLTKNTIVIFTSDHGLALGSHGLTGKQNMYDHTIRVPLIMAGPGVDANRRTDGLCYLRDLYPTICNRCQVPAPANLDGRDLTQLLTNADASGPHHYVFGYFTDTQRMIRSERWKLIRYPKIGREQLFDLKSDPDELHDQIGDPVYKDVADDLRARLTTWLREHGDSLQAVDSAKP